MTVLLVAVGAAVGAPVRFVAAHHFDRDFPGGTLLVNVVGSFLLGLLSALALSGSTSALLGVGFCGALTTYSTFAVQTSRLGPRRGAAYAALTVVGAVMACALGFWLGGA